MKTQRLHDRPWLSTQLCIRGWVSVPCHFGRVLCALAMQSLIAPCPLPVVCAGAPSMIGILEGNGTIRIVLHIFRTQRFGCGQPRDPLQSLAASATRQSTSLNLHPHCTTLSLCTPWSHCTTHKAIPLSWSRCITLRAMSHFHLGHRRTVFNGVVAGGQLRRFRLGHLLTVFSGAVAILHSIRPHRVMHPVVWVISFAAALAMRLSGVGAIPCMHNETQTIAVQCSVRQRSACPSGRAPE